MGVSREAGFTLVELVATMVVCSILILGVNTAFVSQSAASQRARDLVMANAYAEGKFESLRSKGFLGLANGTTSVTSELPSELKAPKSGSLVISSQSTSVKLVNLSITYSEHTIQYSTYIGELGVGQY